MRWRVTEKTFFYSSVSCRPIHLFLDYVATIQQVVVVVAVEGDYIHVVFKTNNAIPFTISFS